MEYSEVELDFIVGIPQLVTNITISDSQWTRGKVGISEQELWLSNEDDWDTIPLKSIELVNRKLPKTIENRIMASSRHSHYIVVDYKKLSMFGTGYVTSSMIFTGDKNNIEKIKSYLLSYLGFSADAEYEQLSPEQVRLLFLLSSGISDMDVLLPIFDKDKILLKHAFAVLKKKKLVDEFALVTSKGFAMVEDLKGKGEGTIGKDLSKSFKQIAKSWSNTTSFKATENMNKVSWKYDISSLIGHINTEHLWKFLPLEHLEKVSIEISESGSNLKMNTEHDVEVTLYSIEDTITFALFDILNSEYNSVYKLVNAIYIGVKDKKDLAYLCSIEPFAVSSKLEYMVQTELIEDDLTLTPKAIKMIRDNMSAKLADSSLTGFVESDRLREFEMEYAKKKMMDKLL
ncbi:MAG: hypothetical protein PWQ75_1351 [Methanolobus sp.]|uniref:CheF family chemotaxis protein n=1 Tax=Methanolobus sp. TaxID=1874737 RepID=UPI0025909639|nr:CheF family chemotaxis protein [Methanolobus sp.]MDK2831599.1 hypothetical protein [Methanolobus sp.]